LNYDRKGDNTFQKSSKNVFPLTAIGELKAKK
jgi:hypothetical protein